MTSSTGPAGPPQGTTASGTSLRGTVLRGAKWTFVGFGISQVLRLGSNIVLAALLFEEAFALMGLVAATMQGLAMFSDIGLGLNIVQSKRGDDRSFLNTAWTIQVVRGILLAAVAIVLAWPIAAFYEARDPMAGELRWLLPIVAMTSIIDGFQSTKTKTAARHLMVRATTSIDLASQVIGLLTTVLLAWQMRSVYAIAIGGVVAASIQCTLSYLALPGPRNHFQWDRGCVRELVFFGKWIFLSTIVSFLALQVDRFVFAGLFPLKEVGVYSIAAGLAILMPMLMGRVQSTLVFPLYSRLLDRKMPIRECLRQTKLPLLALGGYLTAGMIACSPTLVGVVYDHRYAAAATYLPILAAGSWFAIMDGTYGAVFLATGQTRWVAAVNAIKVACFILLLWPCIVLGGLTGAVVAVAASDALKFIATITFASRTVGFRDFIMEARFTLFVALVGIGVLGLTELAATWSRVPLLFTLVAQGTLVTLAFLPSILRTIRTVTANR